MTTMSMSGDRVHAENVAAGTAGVARRGLWRGKSRMVPVVLLSGVLMVTGAAGAQASVSSNVNKYDVDSVVDSLGPSRDSQQDKFSVRGAVEITEFRTKVTMNLVDEAGMSHKFTGYTVGGVIPTNSNFEFRGVLETKDIRNLFYETLRFRYIHRDGVVIVSFLDRENRTLGSVSIEKGSLPLLPYMGSGVGKWERS